MLIMRSTMALRFGRHGFAAGTLQGLGFAGHAGIRMSQQGLPMLWLKVLVIYCSGLNAIGPSGRQAVQHRLGNRWIRGLQRRKDRDD
jgi:hypothetical protein